MNSFVAINVIIQDKKTKPFFSKDVAIEHAKIFSNQETTIHSIKPEDTNCPELLQDNNAYLISYNLNGRTIIVDNDGSFTVEKEFFNSLNTI